MKFIVIFLCMVIGYAASDLQRIEIGKDDLKVNENAVEAVTLDTRETNIHDQYIRSKDVLASVHSVATSSNETETYEQLPTEEKKRRQKVYFGTRVMHNLRSLLKQFHRHIHAQNASKKVQKSYPETSAAILRTDAYFATKTRKLFRMKRSPERDAKRSKFAPFQMFGNVVEIRKNLPQKMMKIIYAANDAEEHLLDSLASTGGAPASVYNKYQAAKTAERKAVQAAMAETPEKASAVVKSYKMMIRDGTFDDYLYDHFKLRERHAAFFDKPSAALKKYNNLKRQEFQTLDSFLKGKSQGKVPAPSFNKVPAKIKGQAAAKHVQSKKVPAKIKSQPAAKHVQSKKVPAKIKSQPAAKHVQSKKVPSKIKSKPAVKHSNKKAAAEPASKKKPAKHRGKHAKSKVMHSRQGRSKTPLMHGQVFVIFLCMVIGYAAVHLQRVELGVDDLKVNENAMEAVSLDATERNIQDQYIRWKDVHASVHSVATSSNESETYEQLPSVVTSMTEGKKRRQKVYFGTRVMHNLWSLLRNYLSGDFQ